MGSQHRTSRRQWKIEVTHRQQAKVPVVLPAHTVSPPKFPHWDGPQAGGEGLRLTVLLDAAPLNIRPVRSRLGRATPPNGGALKLRAWDQAFLLRFLSSLLQKTPCQSVRLVAFNLDQQREILRADPFVPSGFASLQEAFRDLELGTVSVQVLEQRQGWAQMLADLTNQELIAPEPSDAVIFLGPSTRRGQKIPKEMLKPRETRQPRFFYFEYASTEFPDAIGYLTKARDGTVFKIHSPHELGQAIEKMLAQLKPVDQKADAGASRHRNSPE
ncbi:MAG: hypothetical protein ABSB82_22420 [Terriglobia bacterium]|jgi:hypothetical protein